MVLAQLIGLCFNNIMSLEILGDVTFILLTYFLFLKNHLLFFFIYSIECHIEFILMAITYYTNTYDSMCLIYRCHSLFFYFFLCFSLMQLRMCNPGRGKRATISSPCTLFTETHATNLTCACVLRRQWWKTSVSKTYKEYVALLPVRSETVEWLII